MLRLLFQVREELLGNFNCILLIKNLPYHNVILWPTEPQDCFRNPHTFNLKFRISFNSNKSLFRVIHPPNYKNNFCPEKFWIKKVSFVVVHLRKESLSHYGILAPGNLQFLSTGNGKTLPVLFLRQVNNENSLSARNCGESIHIHLLRLDADSTNEVGVERGNCRWRCNKILKHKYEKTKRKDVGSSFLAELPRLLLLGLVQI